MDIGCNYTLTLSNDENDSSLHELQSKKEFCHCLRNTPKGMESHKQITMVLPTLQICYKEQIFKTILKPML